MIEKKQSEFSTVKQNLSAQQKILKTALDDGRLPQEKEVAEFAALSEKMESLCDPEWRSTIDAYMNQLEKFQAAVTDGNPQSASDRFQELLDRKISCHKTYR